MKISMGVRTKPKIEIPVALLRELLDYDPLTGILTWKPRLPRHFAGRPWVWKTWNKMWAGKPVGAAHGNGYLKTSITVEGKKHQVFLHQIAVALMTGTWPEYETDHDDHDRSNNRWKNLKPVTLGQNQQNLVAARSHSKTRLLGVIPIRNGRFLARIVTNGEIRHLGTFRTPEAAHAKYLEAKKQFHGR